MEREKIIATIFYVYYYHNYIAGIFASTNYRESFKTTAERNFRVIFYFVMPRPLKLYTSLLGECEQAPHL